MKLHTEGATKTSPLYTSKKDAEAKAKRSTELGKDTDGAYRLKNRFDKEDKNRA